MPSPANENDQSSFPRLLLAAPQGGGQPLVIDCLADLHLQASQPATWQGFASYLQSTPASHVLLLGDIFEVWVGDDCLLETGSFEAEVAQVLRESVQRGTALYLMHGNRDFTIGAAFFDSTGVRLLQDPTVLEVQSPGMKAGSWLLTHGDALCTDDTAYQQFRRISREPAWQQKYMLQPLASRRAFAAGIRNQSEQRKHINGIDTYVDLNLQAMHTWLEQADCLTLIHGHTHKPGTQELGRGRRRITLSDWDLDVGSPRAEILRLEPHNGSEVDWQRLSLV